MNYIITRTNQLNELYHHGVKGMKWGHRKQDYKAEKQTSKKQLTRSDKQYAKELKKYQKAKGYQATSKYLSETYNRPSVKASTRANKSAIAAKYKRKSDKILSSLSEETMTRIKSEERKKLDQAKRYVEQREAFRKHMDSIISEAEQGNTSRHPGL